MSREDDALEAAGYVIGPRPERAFGHEGHVMRFEPDHPLAWKDGTVFEHRWVVYEAGIEIPPGYHVHHVNGNRCDNRLDNLRVMPNSEHVILHHDERRRQRDANGDNAAARDRDNLLSEDNSEIEVVPDEAREVWTKDKPTGYTREDYEHDKAARERRKL